MSSGHFWGEVAISLPLGHVFFGEERSLFGYVRVDLQAPNKKAGSHH